jgi:hypothetical protein
LEEEQSIIPFYCVLVRSILLPSACDAQRTKTEREVRKLLPDGGAGGEDSDNTTAEKSGSLQYILFTLPALCKEVGFQHKYIRYGTDGSLQKLIACYLLPFDLKNSRYNLLETCVCISSTLFLVM